MGGNVIIVLVHMFAKKHQFICICIVLFPKDGNKAAAIELQVTAYCAD